MHFSPFSLVSHVFKSVYKVILLDFASEPFNNAIPDELELVTYLLILNNTDLEMSLVLIKFSNQVSTRTPS
jgi:hypothetical protein